MTVRRHSRETIREVEAAARAAAKTRNKSTGIAIPQSITTGRARGLIVVENSKAIYGSNADIAEFASRKAVDANAVPAPGRARGCMAAQYSKQPRVTSRLFACISIEYSALFFESSKLFSWITNDSVAKFMIVIRCGLNAESPNPTETRSQTRSGISCFGTGLRDFSQGAFARISNPSPFLICEPTSEKREYDGVDPVLFDRKHLCKSGTHACKRDQDETYSAILLDEREYSGCEFPYSDKIHEPHSYPYFLK